MQNKDSLQPPDRPPEGTVFHQNIVPSNPRRTNKEIVLGATLIIFLQFVVIAFLGYQNYQLKHQGQTSPQTRTEEVTSAISPALAPLGCITEGETLFPNDGRSCCSNLKPEWNYLKLENNSCQSISKPLFDNQDQPQAGGHQLVCINCGDGICSKGENGCICPKDCRDLKCKEHGEVPTTTDSGDNLDIQCCQGLKHVTQKDFFDKNCQLKPTDDYIGICLACGNGTCDTQFESHCNCPEDCP
ncbi:MAG TPA: hypothetical protein VMW41_06490 [Candidatus Bathyarchaeia archaeon]|nr:hypothetical protein [Candidatus Bathyarchaeia archaeon]